MLSEYWRPKQASDANGDRFDFEDIGAGDFFKAVEFHYWHRCYALANGTA
jgi:hypothetical protein